MKIIIELFTAICFVFTCQNIQGKKNDVANIFNKLNISYGLCKKNKQTNYVQSLEFFTYKFNLNFKVELTNIRSDLNGGVNLFLKSSNGVDVFVHTQKKQGTIPGFKNLLDIVNGYDRIQEQKNAIYFFGLYSSSKIFSGGDNSNLIYVESKKPNGRTFTRMMGPLEGDEGFFEVVFWGQLSCKINIEKMK